MSQLSTSDPREGVLTTLKINKTPTLYNQLPYLL